jgi:hypothetical protein
LKNDEEDKASQKDEELLREPMTHDEMWEILHKNCCRQAEDRDMKDAVSSAVSAAAAA